MKRKIFALVILLLEIAFGVIFYIKDIWNVILEKVPFLGAFGTFAQNIIREIKTWINSNFFKHIPSMIQSIIIVIVLNIIFFALYFLIFGIINKVIRSIKKKKIGSQNASRIWNLSDEELAKFDYKLFIKKFPLRRIISLIIPLGVMFIFILIRFDKYICKSYDDFNVGYFSVFSEYRPYLGQFGESLERLFKGYIFINNSIVQTINVTWVEFIEIGFVTILLCFIWYGFFSLFAIPFRKSHAKYLAKQAKNKYIIKMENIEYRAIKKAEKEKRLSEKNKQLFNEVSFNENEVNVESIVESTVIVNNDDVDMGLVGQQDYIDDISTGVTDLGIVEEDTSELQEPLNYRETHFVGDEEVDIVLEEEPIVETIEEDQSYYNYEDEEESFEPYNFNVNEIELDDKIKKYNIEVIEEGEDLKKYEEENNVIEEFDDRQIYVEKVEQLKKEENLIDENKEEDIDILSLFIDAPSNIIEEKEEVIKEILIEEKEENIDKDLIFEKEEVIEKTVLENKENVLKRPVKPVSINRERSKVVEYILNNNDGSSLAIKEELKPTTKIKMLHPVNKNKKNIKPVSSQKKKD